MKKAGPLEPLKLEISAELGLIAQIEEKGWNSLSARDAGRIGGLMAQRRRREIVKQPEQPQPQR
ncbi:MAG: small, acid-soluble spore protein, alpha/beta type [Peptococcaceae bacterium]|nr:small, acid-soluble spore protein, alpha/beta type [Peptococcaceae bacterium]